MPIQLRHYLILMRAHQPRGIFLLLWPALWALWLAGQGGPDLAVVLIFCVGVVLMRSAGCVINDIADYRLDPHVARTQTRPIAAKLVTRGEAFILFLVLLLAAASLLLFLPLTVFWWALPAAGVTVIYPFCKRFFVAPQLVLGVAFSWSIPMAYEALGAPWSLAASLLWIAALIWPVIYDTMYGMVDMADDLTQSVHSTAILFGRDAVFYLFLMQVSMLLLFVLVGWRAGLRWPYYGGLVIAGLCCLYQQWLIRDAKPSACLRAFLNNNYLGLFIFIGLVCAY